ncbi:unnamed protein product [Brachionus calyciflorus]|uniref:SWIM-type domain-containing protein n=1 Tax=Brachionus calyciflorus TaxID=104777 RepID=A0A814IJL0_9BILA|nr:unnamed protein product [Brachionus calyciflorus]
MQEIENMHYCKNENEFKLISEKVLTRWSKNDNLQEFKEYFKSQWLNSEFNNWQIYISLEGFASTNNTLESFNGRIKKYFTKGEPVFNWSRLPNSKVKNISKLLPDQSFLRKSVDKVEHQGLSSIHTIDVNRKTCDCRWFLAYGMCGHLYKASQLFAFSLDNEKPTKFVVRPRAGKKKRYNNFRQNFNNQINPPNEIAVANDPAKYVVVVNAKRGPGRPKKRKLIDIDENIDKNLQNKKRGRPPKAKPALELD